MNSRIGLFALTSLACCACIYGFQWAMHACYWKFGTFGFLLTTAIFATITIPGVYQSITYHSILSEMDAMLASMLLGIGFIVWEIAGFIHGAHGWPWLLIVVRLVSDVFILRGIAAAHRQVVVLASLKNPEFAEFIRKDREGKD